MRNWGCSSAVSFPYVRSCTLKCTKYGQHVRFGFAFPSTCHLRLALNLCEGSVERGLAASQAAGREEKTSHRHPDRGESRCMRSSWRKHTSGFVLTDNRVETGYCPFLFPMPGYDLALFYLFIGISFSHTAVISECLLITMFKWHQNGHHKFN